MTHLRSLLIALTLASFGACGGGQKESTGTDNKNLCSDKNACDTGTGESDADGAAAGDDDDDDDDDDDADKKKGEKKKFDFEDEDAPEAVDDM